MTWRFRLIGAGLALSIGAVLAGGTASAADRIDPYKRAAKDPRSGAALNLERAKTNPGPPQVPLYDNAVERIRNNTVNDPAADATARDTQSETSVIDLGRGNLVAAFNDSGSTNDAVSLAHFTGFAFSSNGGKSWTDGGALPDSGEGDAGDPVLAYDKSAKRVYLATLGFNTGENIQVFRSDDKGQTFAAPVNGTPGFAGTGDFQDKEWLAVDNFRGDGKGNVYLCWTRFIGGGGAEIRFTRSTNKGDSFGPNQGVLLSTGGQGCFVVVGPQHDVYVFFYRGTGGSGQGGDNKLFMRRSKDRGVTFQPEVVVADLNTTSTNGALALNGGQRSNSFPHAAVNPDRSAPYIYVIYNDDPTIGDNADNGDIFIARSTNRGRSFKKRVRVNDDRARDQFFPTIAVDKSGALMIGYYSANHDPNNAAFHRRGRLGEVVGDSFAFLNGSFQMAPNTPVVIGQDPVINPTYMGDYDQIDAKKGRFSSTWADNRYGNGFHTNQPDVFFGRIVGAPGPTDLRVVLNSRSRIGLGQAFKMTADVTAVGGQANDTFIDIPPVTGLTFESASVPGGDCDIINGFVDCNLREIGPGAMRTVTIKTRAGYPPATRTVRSQGTTSSPDGTPANNKSLTQVKVTAGNTVSQTLSTGNIAVPLDGGSVVEIDIDFPPGGASIYALPKVRINHTWDSDVQLSLVSPTGETVSLVNGRGGSGDNFGSGANDCSGTPTAFDDAAATPISAGTPPFAGAFQPEQPLGGFNGVDATGTWTLRAVDTFPAADEGIIGCFELTIIRQP